MLLPLAFALATAHADVTDTGDSEPVAPPVVGGQKAKQGAWPSAAGIVFGWDVGCTGVLVHPRVVLTAGHCTDDRITEVQLDTANYYQTEGELIGVKKTIPYPNWWNTYDIAALVLERDAKTEPTLIATDCALDELKDGAEVAIVGFGAHDQWGEQYDSKLREAFTTITDHDCSDLDNGCVPRISPGGELGAGGGGIDACYGDSGGPLYMETQYGRYVVGLTSRAYDWVNVPCRDGGIYVRPDAVFDWIEEATGQTLERATCNAAPEPTVANIKVKVNDQAKRSVFPNDPDEGDSHSYQLDRAPEHGELSLRVNGVLVYTPDADYIGPDSALITVFDDGSPAQSAQAEVSIEVLSRADWREQKGGCSTGGSPAGALPLLGLLLPLLARRRQD